MKPEAAFWSTIRKNLEPDVHACRVENRAGRGMGDVNMCRGGVEVWVELKIQKPNDLLRFEPSQLLWIRKRLDSRGRVVVMTRKGSEVRLYAGGVCFGTREKPPVLKNKKIWVVADPRYMFYSDHTPVEWVLLVDRLFGWCKHNAA